MTTANFMIWAYLAEPATCKLGGRVRHKRRDEHTHGTIVGYSNNPKEYPWYVKFDDGSIEGCYANELREPRE